jgi:hypothetical protein
MTMVLSTPTSLITAIPLQHSVAWPRIFVMTDLPVLAMFSTIAPATTFMNLVRIRPSCLVAAQSSLAITPNGVSVVLEHF